MMVMEMVVVVYLRELELLRRWRKYTEEVAWLTQSLAPHLSPQVTTI